MAKMMMGQIDHARARVRAIKTELLGKSPKPPKVYTIDDLVQGFRDGTVVFAGTELLQFAKEWVEDYTNERNSYRRPNFENTVLEYAFKEEREADQARYERQRVQYDALAHKVNTEATKVEDAIVLGDQHAALAALQSFASFKP
jgi:hypothetical protein